MNKKEFLERYQPFFLQCVPQPTEERVCAIVPKALAELEKILEQLTREKNPQIKKSPQEIQKTAENILETKLPKMLGVRGPTPYGSRGRYTSICNKDYRQRKVKIVCALCNRKCTKRWSAELLCDACGSAHRTFLVTYHEYLSFLKNLTEKEKNNAAWEARRIYLLLTRKKGPPKGKNAKMFIIKTVIPALKKWHEKKMAMSGKGEKA